jgi:hypothetical protein
MVAPHKPNPPLKVHKLTWFEIVECRLKGVFYNYGEKHSLRHEFKEQKLFMAISNDIFYDEFNGGTQEEVTPTTEEVHLPNQLSKNPTFSLHALTNSSSPQTLNLISYIKHQKIIILINNATPIISFIVALHKKHTTISTLLTTFIL